VFFEAYKKIKENRIKR